MDLSNDFLQLELLMLPIHVKPYILVFFKPSTICSEELATEAKVRQITFVI